MLTPSMLEPQSWAADLEALDSRVTGLEAQKTDGIMPVPIAAFVSQPSGQWAISRTNPGVLRLRRTAGASGSLATIPVYGLPLRSTDNVGFKILGFRAKWEVTVSTADVLAISLINTAVPVAGAAVSNGVSYTGTWETAYDTDAERGVVGNHTATFTLTTPDYINAGQLNFEINVSDAAGGTAVVDLYQLEILYARI